VSSGKQQVDYKITAFDRSLLTPVKLLQLFRYSNRSLALEVLIKLLSSVYRYRGLIRAVIHRLLFLSFLPSKLSLCDRTLHGSPLLRLVLGFMFKELVDEAAFHPTHSAVYVKIDAIPKNTTLLIDILFNTVAFPSERNST